MMTEQKQKIDFNTLLPVLFFLGAMIYFYYATPPKLSPGHNQLTGTAGTQQRNKKANKTSESSPFEWLKDIKDLPIPYNKVISLKIQEAFNNKVYSISAVDALYKLPKNRVQELEKYPFRILVSFYVGDSADTLRNSFNGTANIAIIDKKHRKIIAFAEKSFRSLCPT